MFKALDQLKSPPTPSITGDPVTDAIASMAAKIGAALGQKHRKEVLTSFSLFPSLDLDATKSESIRITITPADLEHLRADASRAGVDLAVHARSLMLDGMRWRAFQNLAALAKAVECLPTSKREIEEAYRRGEQSIARVVERKRDLEKKGKR